MSNQTLHATMAKGDHYEIYMSLIEPEAADLGRSGLDQAAAQKGVNYIFH